MAIEQCWWSVDRTEESLPATVFMTGAPDTWPWHERPHQQAPVLSGSGPETPEEELKGEVPRKQNSQGRKEEPQTTM